MIDQQILQKIWPASEPFLAFVDQSPPSAVAELMVEVAFLPLKSSVAILLAICLRKPIEGSI